MSHHLRLNPVVPASQSFSSSWLESSERQNEILPDLGARKLGQSVITVRGNGKVGVFSAETQKMVAERMIENTPKLVFYVMKSHPSPGDQPLVTYQASVPGNGYHCTAQINVKPDYPEDQVKRIVATFAAK
jgi:hypothetical protein